MFPIQLKEVVPKPLEGLYAHDSIWGKETEILENKSYLVKAASGKGKSTLVAYMLRLRDDYTGEILLAGKQLKKMGESGIAHLRSNEMAVVPQDLRLFSQLTVWENILLTERVTAIYSKADILKMSTELGIAEKMDSLCGKLSYGQQQRVALLRAMCRPFKLLMLDEPFSHLDEENITIAQKIIGEEMVRNKASLILTSLGSDYGFPFTQTLTV